MQHQGRLTSALERVADGLDRAYPKPLPRLVPRDRPTDASGLQIPRRLPLTTFLTSIPGLAAQFQREVPVEHLELADGLLVVRCMCGTSTRLDGSLTRCAGGCWRFFLIAGPKRVLVAGPYAADDEDDELAA